MCSVGSHTVFVYFCSGQTWKEDCSTLYFRKDYWKERTGAWHVCDWEKFLNELQQKKTYENLFLRKMSWFYSGEKRKSLSTVWWFRGLKKKKKTKNISAPFSSFYSKGKKISLRFLTLVAPPRHPAFIYFLFPSNGWRQHSISQSSLLFSFSFPSFSHRFEWIGDRKELLIDMCHPLLFSGSSSAIPSIHPFLSHPLCQHRISHFFCVFSMV